MYKEDKMSRKRKSLLLVFVIVILIVFAWAIAQVSPEEAADIAIEAAGVENGIESIPKKDFDIGNYFEDNKHVAYDIQFKYDNEYYFYVISRNNGDIWGYKKMKDVKEFPVSDFPISQEEMNK